MPFANLHSSKVVSHLKILITGGAGFIGSYLSDAYLRDDHQVVIVDDLSAGHQSNIEQAISKGAIFYEASILDREKIHSIFQKEKPDLINHHAAQKSVRDSVTDPVKDAQINLIGLLNVLEEAKTVDCKQFVFASSGGVVYGDQREFPATENHPTSPLSPYGVSKLASEHYLYFYHKDSSFDVACLRYANVYGPRQDPFGEAGVVAIFSKKMLAGDDTFINGDGQQTRDFVFVDDIVSANLLLSSGLKGFELLNVGTGIETDINDIHSQLKTFADYKKKAPHRDVQPGEQRRSVLSSSKIQKRVGWKPKTSLKDGLEQTVEWFRKNQ